MRTIMMVVAGFVLLFGVLGLVEFIIRKKGMTLDKAEADMKKAKDDEAKADARMKQVKDAIAVKVADIRAKAEGEVKKAEGIKLEVDVKDEKGPEVKK